MLEYLVNYGINRHNVDYEDVDVNDRMALQDQINEKRREYHQLLELLDSIQDETIKCNRKLKEKTKEIIDDCTAKGERITSATYSSDDDYLELETEKEALRMGANMVSNWIDFCKNDLRILNSVFYNKF